MRALVFLSLLPGLAAAAPFDWRGEAAPVVNVLDPEVLGELEQNGFSLGELLGGKAQSEASALHAGNSAYRSLADVVGKPLPHDPITDQLPAQIPASAGDIPDLVRLYRNLEDKGKRSDKDSKGGFFIRQLANNSSFPYAVEREGDEPRHFDERWLSSPFASFRLIAVVNRLDRADFHPDHCGEARFVYRLAYRSPAAGSTLPFFLSVVKEYPKAKDCSAVAKRWIAPTELLPAARAKFLQDGPLRELTLRQVELNYQALRFTSGYMHDFGGQAMYLQRIFRLVGGILSPIGLENTPDVLALEKDPALLEKFGEFLRTGDHLRRLDEGTLQIDFDDRFLAKISASWSTLGRAREANRPYARLFREHPELLAKLPLDGLKFIRTPAALVERLDNLTCTGCHQAGGTAGFHLLGYAQDRFSSGFNRQELPLSPHAFAEAARRMAYTQALAEGKEPARFRPLSVFPEANWSGGAPKYSPLLAGQLCVASPSHFSGAPLCAEGAECNLTAFAPAALLGECVPKTSAAPYAGATCWEGSLDQSKALPPDRGPPPTFNFFAFRDKWKLKGAVHPSQGAYKCVLPQSGAPLGRASRACTVAEENFPAFGEKPTREICGNQGGNGFDACAASGDSGACLESRVVRAMLDTCSPGQFCREDYICQRFPEYQKIKAADYDKKKGAVRVNRSEPGAISGTNIAAAWAQHVGFCVPTYFLFNMRLDGHPSPVSGLAPGAPKLNPLLPLRGYK